MACDWLNLSANQVYSILFCFALLGIAVGAAAEMLRPKAPMKTRLEWHPDSIRMTWDAAQKYVKGLDDGWRLPTVQELVQCFGYTEGEPTMREFVSGVYWSSAFHVPNSSNAWHVNFYNGHVHYDSKTASYCVRCVREIKEDHA